MTTLRPISRFSFICSSVSLFVLVLGNFADGASPRKSALDDGIVAYYSFDSLSNLGVDDSGNGHNATLQNGVASTAGRLGNGLSFDGTDDYVDLDIGSVINALTNSTFATWTDFSNQGGAWQRIFDFGNDATVNMFLTPRMGTDGSMRYAMTISGNANEQMVTAPSTLATGWHYVVVVIDADADIFTLYLDGASQAETTLATLTPSDLGNTTNNWLGRSQYTADGYYQGAIDEFGIWNRALSETEISQLYNNGNGLNPLDQQPPPPLSTRHWTLFY